MAGPTVQSTWVWIGERCWSSQLPSADLRIDALPLSQLRYIGTSYPNSLFGATVLYEDCVLWLENNIKRYVNRHVMVDAVPAGVSMAFPAPTKSIPFSFTIPTVATKCRMLRGLWYAVSPMTRVLSSYIWSVLHISSCSSGESRFTFPSHPDVAC